MFIGFESVTGRAFTVSVEDLLVKFYKTTKNNFSSTDNWLPVKLILNF